MFTELHVEYLWTSFWVSSRDNLGSCTFYRKALKFPQNFTKRLNDVQYKLLIEFREISQKIFWFPTESLWSFHRSRVNFHKNFRHIRRKLSAISASNFYGSAPFLDSSKRVSEVPKDALRSVRKYEVWKFLTEAVQTFYKCPYAWPKNLSELLTEVHRTFQNRTSLNVSWSWPKPSRFLKIARSALFELRSYLKLIFVVFNTFRSLLQKFSLQSRRFHGSWLGSGLIFIHSSVLLSYL